VINPSFECSIPYNGAAGCESFPISPVGMPKKQAVGHRPDPRRGHSSYSK
jgi:hypothetical protein